MSTPNAHLASSNDLQRRDRIDCGREVVEPQRHGAWWAAAGNHEIGRDGDVGDQSFGHLGQ